MKPVAKLSPIEQKFIIHWGEMGERWGINRAVAQIHGLLYLSSEPLNAKEICATLTMARSTVSVGLHELESWGIIKVVHIMGDRTDHFDVKGDAWEMFRWIVDYRKRREIDPTLNMLREAVADLEENDKAAHSKAKMLEMLDLFETVDSLFAQAQKVPTKTIVRMAKMNGIVGKFLKLFPDI